MTAGRAPQARGPDVHLQRVVSPKMHLTGAGVSTAFVLALKIPYGVDFLDDSLSCNKVTLKLLRYFPRFAFLWNRVLLDL